jgi:hypothetical protein
VRTFLCRFYLCNIADGFAQFWHHLTHCTANCSSQVKSLSGWRQQSSMKRIGQNYRQILRRRIQHCFTTRLRKVFKIFWPNTISDDELWSLAHETPLEQQIKCRKWKWIGHTLRKGPTAIENQALNCNHQGQRRKGRPRMTWNSKQNMEGGQNATSSGQSALVLLCRSPVLRRGVAGNWLIDRSIAIQNRNTVLWYCVVL